MQFFDDLLTIVILEHFYVFNDQVYVVWVNALRAQFILLSFDFAD